MMMVVVVVAMMMAMAFIFEAGLPFNRPSFTAEVSTMDGGENQKKCETRFSVANCCGAWNGRKFVKVHFLPKNKAMRPWWLLIPGYPHIPMIFLKGFWDHTSKRRLQAWCLKSPNEPDRCTWSPFWGLLMDEKSKIQFFFNPFSKMAMMRCFSYIKEVTLFLVLQSRKPTQASLLEGWRVRLFVPTVKRQRIQQKCGQV